MPYDVGNPPKIAKNWTKPQQARCVAAANAVLGDGGSEQDAIFACIHAAGKSKVKKEDSMAKPSVHEAGMKRALGLVRGGKINAESSWSWSADESKQSNASDHIGRDGELAIYPIIKEDTVFEHAVNFVFAHAGLNGNDDVRDAALRLKDAITDYREGRAPVVVKLMKSDEKGIVGGVVLTPYVVDKDGDWFPPSEIEGFAYRFMQQSRDIFGPGHLQKEDADPVASFIVPFPTEEDRAKAHSVKVVKEDGVSNVSFEPFDIYEDDYGTGTVRSGEWVLETVVTDEALRARLSKTDDDGGLEAYSANTDGYRTAIGDFDPTTMIRRVIRRSGDTISIVTKA